jgi:hypothetical protein
MMLSAVGIECSLGVVGDAHVHVTIICQDMISILGGSLDHFMNLFPRGSEGSKYLKVRLELFGDTFLATWDLLQLCLLGPPSTSS